MTESNGSSLDVLIVGAGPAGVEAALQAEMLGLSYLLIDKRSVGSLIDETMAEKRFYRVYGRNVAESKGRIEFPDRVLGRELVALWRKQLEPCRVSLGIEARRSERVADGVITVKTSGHDICARRVILSCGTFENPRMLGVAGEIGNPHVYYRLDYAEADTVAGEKILVVGGGNSALETAIQFAERNNVTLVVRKEQFTESVTQGNEAEARELAETGKLALWFESVVESIADRTASVRKGADHVPAPFDRLYVHIGYQKPTEFLESFGAGVNGDVPILTPSFETTIPGVYAIGALIGADSVIESANQAYDLMRRFAEELPRERRLP